jgi:hypothetical protein
MRASVSVSAVTAGIGDSFIDEQLSSCVRNHIGLSDIRQPFLLPPLVATRSLATSSLHLA